MVFCTATAQVPDPRQRFNESFRQAVTFGAGSTQQDFDRALAEFTRADALVSTLPLQDQRRALFGIAVRRAEVLLRAGRTDEARRQCEITMQEFRGDPVAFGGTHRVLLAIVYKECLPDDRFLEVLAGELPFLADPETEELLAERVPSLLLPLRLLNAEASLHRGQTELYRLTMQGIAADLLAEDAPEVDPIWRNKCLAGLAWHFLVLRDNERAAIYLDRLPEADTLYPRALIALRRRDDRTAERLALTLAARDPQFHQLLGDVREVQGRHEQALADYRQALAAAREPLARAAAWNGIGDCLLALGRLDEAGSSYRSGLAALADLPVRHHAATEIAEARKDLARLALARMEPEVAWHEALAALEVLDEARWWIPLDAFGGAWLDVEALAAVDVGLEALLAAEGGWAQPRGAHAFALMERGKARGLLDFAHKPPAGDTAALRKSVAALATTRDPAALQNTLWSLERARAGGEQRSRADAASPLSVTELASQWGQPGLLVLGYWVGAHQAFLCIAHAHGTHLQSLGSAAEARELLSAAAAAVRVPDMEAGAALAEASRFFLPDGLRTQLAETRRILFSPDGVLHALPFEALPIRAADGNPLPMGIGHVVERAPSLSLRALLSGRRPRGDAAVVVDSVVSDQGLTKMFSLSPLMFSELEGQYVASLHQEAKRLSGTAATWTGLQAAIADVPLGLLHVSAHAVTSPTVPSASLLVLSDGPVSMSSLSTVPLQGALVVLSACSGALGEDRAGEGVSGLLMGAFGAGARSVVASGWPVNQQATTDLMRQFHHARSQGLGTAAALQAARSALAASPHYASPYYWAGFAVYGPDLHGGMPEDETLLPAMVTVRSLLGMGLALLILIVLWRVWRSRRLTS